MHYYPNEHLRERRWHKTAPKDQSAKTWHTPAQCPMTNTTHTTFHNWLQNRPNWWPRQEDGLCQIQEMVGSPPNRGCYYLLRWLQMIHRRTTTRRLWLCYLSEQQTDCYRTWVN